MFACFRIIAALARPEPVVAQELPSHRLAVTTDEETWISLDVAADSDRIVLELLGDVFTLPIAGGRAPPLLTGRAFQSQPRYAPDGR